ncbi:DNA replication ATP-dependent helicase/nuclease DNA2-like isoform X2 [Leptotrombidium deliense]|uniref:DNA replication ATP-dependent helicase/nuclease n=1 Tax=Leptotrombidium deliense TaxID=299467 RepID=A0A443SN15_9ACAR|nr:DNA replication ATP-dependent helicase/nuclease DNA2-like isoform X2 [Leptotrombidium deliense]
MESSNKQKQTKIDGFFKRIRKEETHTVENNSALQEDKLSFDDDIIIEKHITKKRRSEVRHISKPTNKLLKASKSNVSQKKEKEKFLLPINAVLKVNRSSTQNECKVPNSDYCLFTSIKQRKAKSVDENPPATCSVNNEILEYNCESEILIESFSESSGNFAIDSNKQNSSLEKENGAKDDKHSLCLENTVVESNCAVIKDKEDELIESVDFRFDGKTFNNFIVLSVDRDKRDLILQLQHNKITLKCILRGFWSMTNIKVGDSVTVLSNVFADNIVFVDENNGVIIVNPEILISSTSLSSSVFCMRKTWLNEKFVKSCSTNKEMFIGCIVHELFQNACMMRIKTEQELVKVLDSIIRQSYVLDGCYANKMSTEQFMSHLNVYIPSIVEWMQKYVDADPSLLTSRDEKFRVVKFHDIEDNIWCTDLGLKGKVDVNLQVEIHENKKVIRKSIPLELKTGKASFSFEHEGQVLLYSMMMNEITDSSCDTGLLLYLKEKPQMKFLKVKENVRSSLLQRRNELVQYLNDQEVGPPPLNNQRLCYSCDSLFPCSMMFKSFGEMKLTDSDVMRFELVPKILDHLSDNHINFFQKWVKLTHMEMSVRDTDRKSLKSFWKENAVEREQKGFAFANVIIANNVDLEYTLKRINTDCRPFNVKNTCIRVGDRVALSEDKGISMKSRIAFVIGFISKVEEANIYLTLEKTLNNSFEETTLRVDLLASDKIFSQYLANLLQLMAPEKRESNLRNYIIDGVKAKRDVDINKRILPLCQPIISSLNISQQKAVLKSVQAEDFTLICGTPGSGKTTTIVSIMRVLTAMKKRILVTSYTHSALDNILLKFKKFDINFLRLGFYSRIHPELRKYSLESQLGSLSSVEETKQFYSNISVVASTCLSLNHPIFELTKFDYCIMDETSQVNLLASLRPLFITKRFILVGDSKQLPPVVKNHEARRQGFDQSIFSLLCDENTVNLTIQYRMNQEIMRVASELMYDGLLECGSREIATSTLIKRSTCQFEKLWLEEILDNSLTKSVIFLNTDEVPAIEEQDRNNLICNRIEAKIVMLIVNNLLKNFDIKCSDIGVITPYAKQVEILREMCNERTQIEINTVDQYQGRDKDAVLISTVVSSTEQTTKELLKDKRRLNVAITRARKKLIIVGSQKTLSLYKPFIHLFSLLKQHQIYCLPVDAHL